MIIDRRLDEYLSSELVSNKYKDKHGYKPKPDRVKAITTHVGQGIEFFRSSKDANVTVKPLLQYYGVASLSRAVCMFTSTKLSEDNMTPSHGLGTYNWKQSGSVLNGNGLKGLTLQVSNGLFTDFCNSTEQKTLLRANSSKANMHATYDTPKIDTCLNFGDLLGLLPELWSNVNKWSRQPKAIYRLKELVHLEDSTLRIMVYPSISDEQAIDLFKVKPISNVHIANDNEETSTLILPGDVGMQFCQDYNNSWGIGDVCIVTPIIGGAYLGSGAILYAISYTLSMLARYHLTDWMSIWNGGKGDAARPTLQIFMDMLERSYSQVCVELMNGHDS